MRLLGRILFWLSWPGIGLVLRGSLRTRVLLVVGDEFLVIQGWLTNGTWGLPGGGVHRGEDVTLAAIREVHEELGVTLAPADLQARGRSQVGALGFKYHVAWFVVVLPAKPALQLQRLEVSEAVWIERHALSDRRLNSEVLTVVRDWWQ